jgi:hypothetical protein
MCQLSKVIFYFASEGKSQIILFFLVGRILKLMQNILVSTNLVTDKVTDDNILENAYTSF